jgi:hypothetical protein
MPQKISLIDAALRLAKSRNQVERLVLIGKLRGGRNAAGKWWVDATALEQFASDGHTDLKKSQTAV